MPGGMVPVPVPPVRAPSLNSCTSPSKPFACHTSEESLKSSTSPDATATHLDSILSCANSFTLISFADPHPLNSVLSYRYENIGGASSNPSTIHLDSILGC